MKLTIRSSTGHLAISQMVTAVPPIPRILPICPARPPVTTTATALMARSTSMTMVTASLTGIVMKNGRPSSMS